MAVDAGAQEAAQVHAVAAGQLAQPRASSSSGIGVGQVEAGGPDGGRDVLEQRLDRVDAERREHPLAVVGRMRTVDHRLRPPMRAR